MTSPIKPPKGNWWDQPVNRRESIWLGLGVGWALVLFGWMSAFTRIGDQNPIGETYRVTEDELREKVQAFEEAAEQRDDGAYVPAGDDVYVVGYQFDWDGLPVVLETGQEYDFHLGSYDVQHGFSIRPEHAYSQQINLHVTPGKEWIIPMEFDEPGTYHVLCNEFCGEGHRGMHNTIIVEEGDDGE
ncbi:cupredoxin domain-containing protein [Halobiforma nitratireducens]|uniref:Cytochrome c oxidase subunit II n=1 Tax=Halobiforma nitratireducens JCM 10879 TaxID=1227454 RepID=M0L1A9_9EURY|nr:hypothetical protein [Halobiforma nitratireducens]EMA27347.1 cytochrome c oxidase subunit II [Halobiforma nitratireducens JCM 10879]